MNFAKNISPEEAKKIIEENKNNDDFVIIDVRTPMEFEMGHIDGAVLIDIYESDFKEQIEKLDKTKTYLIYCRTGARSAVAMNMMAEMGFEKLYNMLYGIVAF